MHARQKHHGEHTKQKHIGWAGQAGNTTRDTTKTKPKQTEERTKFIG